MPVTPFHFGPGLFIKALAPTRFSFTAYVAAQVVIDVESGYNMLMHRWPIHDLMHTFAVAPVAGAVAGVASAAAARRLFPRTRLLQTPVGAAEVAAVPALVGGVVGGLMHIVLDGFQHEEMRPFWPRPHNPMLGGLSLTELEVLCVATGLAGLLLLALRRPWRTAPAPSPTPD